MAGIVRDLIFSGHRGNSAVGLNSRQVMFQDGAGHIEALVGKILHTDKFIMLRGRQREGRKRKILLKDKFFIIT